MKDITNGNERDFLGLGDAFDELFKPVYFDKHALNMKTDIKEDEHHFELDIDMPGLDKNNINVNLEKGYLNVSAKKEQHTEQGEPNKNNYVRRERSCEFSRSYYVGDKIKEDQIVAKYENGVLNLIVPKEEPKELPEHKIHIN